MSEKIRKGFAIILVLALAAAMLTVGGCKQETTTDGEEEPTSEVVKGGTFSQFIINPAAITPTLTYESEGIYVVSAVFDSLVDFDPITSEIIPAVAESWESNEEATVWTFKLRDDVKFHNGRTVVAEDFKYAWERMASPEMASEIVYHLFGIKGAKEMANGEATSIEGVKVIDDTTLEVTMAAPYPDFPYVVGHPCLAPLPKEEVEKDPAAFDINMVGNGPFKMAEAWKADEYIKLVKNEDYYGDEPNVDGIEFKIFKDQETAFLEFEAGNLDFTEVPAGRLESVRATYGDSADGYTANPGEQTLTGVESGIYYIMFNLDNELFQNKELREAISLSVNRQAIIDSLFDGSRTAADSVIPPSINGYKSGLWPAAKYDVEEAKAKLAEAGYPNGEGLPVITLDVNSGSSHEAVFQLVQQDLEAIGIKTELAATEWAVYKDKMGTRTWQIARYGWIWDYPIAENVLYSLFYSESADNESGYNNPEYDKAVTDARSTLDVDERVKGMQDAEAILGEDTPVIPVMYYSHLDVASERVNNLVYSPLNIPDYVHVWVDAAE